MPPRRPLPNRCLISVFKALTPNDQLKASKMSPRCAVLVRAANRRVKTLIITFSYLEGAENVINSLSLVSNPAVQKMLDAPGDPFSDCPMTTYSLSKWHCLLIDSPAGLSIATTEQITNIFSAVTDLKFILEISEHHELLNSLLQHWRYQLTDLMVYGTHWQDKPVAHELIPAINRLTALQHLALEWAWRADIPDLTILAQLKIMVFKSDKLSAFLRSLERNAADNANLQVHLLTGDIESLLTLSQPLHSRIVRVELRYADERVPLLCPRQFRFLTSLSINGSRVSVEKLFTALSQLAHLAYLNLVVKLNENEVLRARPRAQLNSLRTLELDLSITTHSQVQWLNLVQVMPNLQTIIISRFSCRSCSVYFNEIGWDESFGWCDLLVSSQNCLPSSLFTLHAGVPLNRLLFYSDDSLNMCTSAEKVLLQVATGQTWAVGS